MTDPVSVRLAKDLYEDGWSLSQIAAELGVSRWAVRRWAVDQRPDGEPWGGYEPQTTPPAVIRRAKAQYESGWNFSLIAKELRVCPQTVRQWAVDQRPDGEPWGDYMPRHGPARHNGGRL